MSNMKYGKSGYLPQKIKTGKARRNAEQGQASWVPGLFLILFLAILLSMQLQLAMYSASALYLEDALALSNLASAVIDVREYGRTHRVLIGDPVQAYDRYCSAIKENLGLDDRYEAANQKLISGQVRILNYTIYNVTGGRVLVWERNADGQIQEWKGNLGEVRTPKGQIIEATSVYSEISYPVEGFLGITVTAEKSKLVDVVSNKSEEEINEETEDESEMEEQNLERKYYSGVPGCNSGICIFAADGEKSTCGI